MKTRILMSSDLAKCPAKRIDAAHWIPEHHIEQCIPELKAEIAAIRKEVGEKRAAALAQIERLYDGELAERIDAVIAHYRHQV